MPYLFGTSAASFLGVDILGDAISILRKSAPSLCYIFFLFYSTFRKCESQCDQKFFSPIIIHMFVMDSTFKNNAGNCVYICVLKLQN